MEVRFADGTTLRIASHIVRFINEHLADSGFSHESGGIMLGMRERTRPSYVLADMTLPGKLDRCGPSYFVRSKVSANEAIKEAWSRSDGKVNYIGEWHTHAQADPRPSATDRRLIEEVVSDGSCLQDRAFMLIVGNAGKAFLGMAHPESSGSLEEEVIIPWRA